MTPKNLVQKKYPKAELARDGCLDLGDDGLYFFDFAIYTKPGKSGRFLAEGPTPQTAWREARRVIQKRR